MENVYKLTGRFEEANAEYERLSAELDEMYEDNGGEVTEVTEEMQQRIDALDALKKSIIDDIVANADDYAEIALNKAAQQKILEAELKALKEEQKKVVDRCQSRINKYARSVDFWKDNFDQAMQIAQLTKIGGAKTDHRHSIYYMTSNSVDVDEERVLVPYQAAINALKAQLPAWCSLNISINKTELKKAETLPDGAAIVQKKSLLIK